MGPERRVLYDDRCRLAERACSLRASERNPRPCSPRVEELYAVGSTIRVMRTDHDRMGRSRNLATPFFPRTCSKAGSAFTRALSQPDPNGLIYTLTKTAGARNARHARLVPAACPLDRTQVRCRSLPQAVMEQQISAMSLDLSTQLARRATGAANRRSWRGQAAVPAKLP